mmetsp:Transcript_15231/g.30887  ORF Transcript_15231/g.30887 Transcript_15231/m.30887 type:complete len:105 (-) Transcript_15231:4-318(-)
MGLRVVAEPGEGDGGRIGRVSVGCCVGAGARGRWSGETVDGRKAGGDRVCRPAGEWDGVSVSSLLGSGRTCIWETGDRDGTGIGTRTPSLPSWGRTKGCSTSLS